MTTKFFVIAVPLAAILCWATWEFSGAALLYWLLMIRQTV